MKSLKILAAVAIATLSTSAIAQMTNTMGSGSMSKGAMTKGMSKGMSKDHPMIAKHHMASSKMNMSMCGKMSHSRMMHNSKCKAMMMHHGKMMKHAM